VSYILIPTIIITALVIGYCFHRHSVHKEIKEKQLHKSEIENDQQYRQLVSDMKFLVAIITNTPEHYLNIDDRTLIKNCVDEIIKKVDKYKIRDGYYGCQEYWDLKLAQLDMLNKLNKLNETFIKVALEKYKELFDNIDGKSLDIQQRNAIVIDEKNNLVIAGAGSGKTLTILGKVLYLLKCGISPEEILLIAFTKKSAGELEERINRSLFLGIKAITFHKLGLDIITKNNNERPDIDDNMNTYIEDYFSKELIKHQDNVQIFLEFIGYYFNIPIELKADGTLGEKIDREKNVDFETLGEKYNKATAGEKKTIKGEKVKSIEELMIANFLFLNSVKYEYEREYPFETDKLRKRYRPDFYLADYDIYLEHFGVDKNNRCPWLSAVEEQKYIDGMAWKRDTHKTNGTKLIETYSYFQNEGKLLTNLKDILLSNNIKLTRISNENMLLLIKEIQTENTNKEFIKLCGTFINLFKSNAFDEKHFDVLRKEISNSRKNIINHFITARTLHFINIVEKIYLYYQSRLAERKAIDFADMINNATNIVKEHGITPNYKYIIIDEYQDIGMDRYKLIKTIIEKTSAHLMCVGDDWQSIYRFAGSDANLFISFEKYWGCTQVSKIENTYRNSQELINIASAFVMKNKNQIPKILRSKISCEKPVRLHYYNEHNFISVFEKLLDSVVKEYGEEKTILLLGRINSDIDFLRTNKGIESFFIKGNNITYKKYNKLKIEFLTVHKAKGLEADNVIILNMKNDKLGFPNRIADDPVLQLLLPTEDNFAFAEERRLFYVALTRTRNKTFLLVPDRDASEFANEIKLKSYIEIPDGENLIINNPKCPKCKTGRLVIRQASGNKTYFSGCSNFPACDYTNNDTSIIEHPILCPKCGGFLVARNGAKGQFLGCSNYPNCKQTAQINNKK